MFIWKPTNCTKLWCPPRWATWKTSLKPPRPVSPSLPNGWSDWLRCASVCRKTTAFARAESGITGGRQRLARAERTVTFSYRGHDRAPERFGANLLSQETVSVAVHLMGCEYRFACRPSERDDLLEAARYLDEQMREVRDHQQAAELGSGCGDGRTQCQQRVAAAEAFVGRSEYAGRPSGGRFTTQS